MPDEILENINRLLCYAKEEVIEPGNQVVLSRDLVASCKGSWHVTQVSLRAISSC